MRERHRDALSRLGWQQLESLLAAHYRAQGYDVEHCGTGATGARFDGGIDLKLRRGDEYVLVQAKHWNVYQVAHNDVHQLLGLMVNEAATGAVLVSSGEFTRAAVEAASRLGHVQLVDGNALRAMLGSDLPTDAAAVGDRMGDFMSAMGAKARPRVSRRGRHARGPSFATAMLLFVAVCAIVFVLLIRAVLEKTKWTAGPTPAPAAEAPASGTFDEFPPVTVRAERGGATPQCQEVVERGAGVYSDGCTADTRIDPRAAERREQQRRADAAAKVIEATTPEM